MKIAGLKQPYRRMAEYLVTQNCIQEAGDGIYNFYKQGGIMDLFCNAIDKGHNPPITKEIKQNFPPDFDFSGEEEAKSNDEMIVCTYCGINPLKETCKHPKKCSTKTKTKIFVESNNDNMSLFDRLNQRKIEDENLQKTIYTQLAKEGKFDELPDTCEFLEPVELEVCDNKNNEKAKLYVLGKFKNKFIASTITGYSSWNYAQLPTPKIDFSQFKAGDILEITNKDNEKYYGLLHFQNINELIIAFSYKSEKVKGILKEDIKSITKIK